MTQRKYSIDEIDRMRMALETYNAYSKDGWWMSSPKPEEIEAQLRTYMMNGTSPDELVEEAERRRDLWIKRDEEEEAEREAVRIRAEVEKMKAADEKMLKLAQSQKDLQKLQEDLKVATQTLHPWDAIKQYLPKIYGGKL